MHSHLCTNHNKQLLYKLCKLLETLALDIISILFNFFYIVFYIVPLYVLILNTTLNLYMQTFIFRLLYYSVSLQLFNFYIYVIVVYELVIFCLRIYAYYCILNCILYVYVLYCTWYQVCFS